MQNIMVLKILGSIDTNFPCQEDDEGNTLILYASGDIEELSDELGMDIEDIEMDSQILDNWGGF